MVAAIRGTCRVGMADRGVSGADLLIGAEDRQPVPVDTNYRLDEPSVDTALPSVSDGGGRRGWQWYHRGSGGCG